MSLMAANEESDPSAILNGFWVTLILYISLSRRGSFGEGVEEGRGCRYLCTLPDESVGLPRPIRIVVKEMRGAGRGVIPAIQ